MHKYIFLDTNVFEQFQPITDVDWLKLAKCERITLLVPSVTVRELNEHKDGATRGRLKRKAAAVLIDLKKYLDQGPPVRIRDGVDLDFRPHEPKIDFHAYQLDANLDDDRLIASAIDFAVEKRPDPDGVVVATGDFGLELKVSSQKLVKCLAFPADLRLPDELDSDEKRIKELELENRALKAVRPRLSLEFKGGGTVLKHARKDDTLSESNIREILTRTRDGHPHKPVPEPKGDRAFNRAFDFTHYERQAVSEYNARLDDYYAEMQDYLTECGKTLERLSSTLGIELLLGNNGGSPAEDIDVRLTFPEDMVSLKKSEVPKLPKKPEPPTLPSSISGIASLLGNYGRPFDYALPELASTFRRPELSNASIYSTGEGSAEFHIRKVKHLTTEELPDLYLHFKSGMKSCSLEYEVIAGNIPEALTGELALVIE